MTDKTEGQIVYAFETARASLNAEALRYATKQTGVDYEQAVWLVRCYLDSLTDGGNLVESRDADGRLLGLLVTEECDECDGQGKMDDHPFTDPTFNPGDRVPTRYLPTILCSVCGGSGQRYRAEVIDYTPNCWCNDHGTYHAVLPLPEPRP